MKFIFKSIITVVAAIVLLFGFLYFYTGGMTSVAEDFFAAVTAEKPDQANSMLSNYITDDSAYIYGYLKTMA